MKPHTIQYPQQKKAVIFISIDPRFKLFFKCGNIVTETTDSYNYFGVICCKSGNFTIAQDHLSKQANKAIQALIRTFSNHSNRADATTQLFDTLVLSILTYGLKVWYPYIEQVTGDPIDTLFKHSTGNRQSHENAHVQLCRQTEGVRNKAMRILVRFYQKQAGLLFQ